MDGVHCEEQVAVSSVSTLHTQMYTRDHESAFLQRPQYKEEFIHPRTAQSDTMQMSSLSNMSHHPTLPRSQDTAPSIHHHIPSSSLVWPPCEKGPNQ